MSEVNVTPLVDVVLVLLIIFMITAPMMTVGVHVDLPQTCAAPIQDQIEPLVVTLQANGKVYIQETETPMDGLIARLQAITQNKPDTKIFVRADKKIAYGEVMEMMGTISAAGFHKVALIAEQNVSS
jgi:biopolymer transport protein TolR